MKRMNDFFPMNSIKVGLLGIGTVGAGTYKVLKRNQHEISGRAGRPIEVAMVAARNLERARRIVDDDVMVVGDPALVVNDPEIDVVVEVIGGCTVAKELVLQAIANGKHVVTANKALLAMHGSEIFAAASERGVAVAFEGAVAVSIPIIKALREGLSANRIEWVAGIINGTTNFILSEMRDKELPFDVVLKEAQRLGYAEADPAFDIEGVDAGHKLTIMAAIAFGMPMQFAGVHIEGIAGLAATDIATAESLGYRIKLLGIAKRTPRGIELRVHPTLVPAGRLIANVEGSMNAIMVKSDAAGVTMYYGAGAGSEQTASAVIADLIDIARLATADPAHRVPYLAFQPGAIADMPILPIPEIATRYYLRMRMANQPYVQAEVAGILADAAIGIDTMLGKNVPEDESRTDVIVLTQQAREKDMIAALAKIEALPALLGGVNRIRMEALD
jgi:homoserine dehydrogenase